MFMWLGTHVGSQPPFLVARESFWVLWRFLDHRMVPCGVPWVLHGSSGSWMVPQVPGWFLGAMGGLPLLLRRDMGGLALLYIYIYMLA